MGLSDFARNGEDVGVFCVLRTQNTPTYTGYHANSQRAKKMRVWKAGWLGWLVGWLVAVFLLACTPEKAVSPEQAVYLKIREYQGVLADTIQVQPAVGFRNSIFVLSSYNLNVEESEQHCVSLFELERTDSGWKIYSGHRHCSSDPHRSVFSTSTGVNIRSRVDETTPYSFVIVETVISDAVWVDITWQDGEIQRVPVIDDYFTAFRDGAHYPLRFVVLDENGNETYVWEENYDAEVIEITP